MLDRLADRIGADVRGDVPLRDLTTFQIGGPARYLCEATRTDILVAAIDAAEQEGIPHLVLGGGSNLLVLDGGFDGLVIHNRSAGIEIDGGNVRVASGESFHGLIEQVADAGLAGLGFAAGVPGTVGGAVFGNAGCYGQAIGDRIVEVSLVSRSDRVQRTVTAGELGFDYRRSRLPASGDFIAAVTLRLDPGDPAELRAEIERYLEVRRQKHPVDLPSAGSYFKNLPPAEPGGRRIAAGLLLDQVGCKGLRVGDAAVFEKHANMIVNRGRASAADVLALAAEMKLRVRGRFGADLVEEVRRIGEP